MDAALKDTLFEGGDRSVYFDSRRKAMCFQCMDLGVENKDETGVFLQFIV